MGDEEEEQLKKTWQELFNLLIKVLFLSFYP
jgi:hypothetical protein